MHIGAHLIATITREQKEGVEWSEERKINCTVWTVLQTD